LARVLVNDHKLGMRCKPTRTRWQLTLNELRMCVCGVHAWEHVLACTSDRKELHGFMAACWWKLVTRIGVVAKSVRTTWSPFMNPLIPTIM